MASDPGRNSPDDPFAASTTMSHSPVGYADSAEHTHTGEAHNETRRDLTESAEGLYSAPSIEIVGSELYDRELHQHPDLQA